MRRVAACTYSKRQLHTVLYLFVISGSAFCRGASYFTTLILEIEKAPTSVMTMATGKTIV
jgi:hypothetical protein